MGRNVEIAAIGIMYFDIPVEARHAERQRNALGDLVMDTTISGDHVVALVGLMGDGSGDRLLVHHRLSAEHDLPRRQASLDRLSDGADAQHLAINFPQHSGLDRRIGCSIFPSFR